MSERPKLSDADIVEKFARSKRRPPCSDTLSMEVLAVDQEAGTVRLKMVGRPEWCNPMGGLQGGFVTAMLDEAMAVAGMIAGGFTHLVPTLELKTSFLRPCPPGAVKAVGRVVRFGSRVAFLEAELFDADGRAVARASATAAPTPIGERAARVE